MNMIMKLKAFWSLFKAGKEVTNASFWAKTGAYGTPVLVGIVWGILNLLKGTGYEVHISEQEVTAICAGIFTIGHWVFAHITSKRVGIVSNIPASAEIPVSFEEHTEALKAGIKAVSVPAVDAVGNQLAVSMEQVREAKELLERERGRHNLDSKTGMERADMSYRN